ncbi:MAG: CDP-glucose 4,6-dehydratase [Oscillospiraceae bacterium]|jgi:CDP-glucose 4,6-dehydratase|nr:CDP-glucose 4,6-dehydratase [Oscillospiraceae bacterium]
MQTLQEFYQGRRVFVTGHTGFKGAWLSQMLRLFGAEVTGYALAPPTDPSLYQLLDLAHEMTSVIGDVRDFSALKAAFDKAQPEIVLHLAAQPIVLTGYSDPRGTYDTNVMGTVNLLECVRGAASVRSVVNVTTDKVYRRHEKAQEYHEEDVLNGFDPYSNSKSCSELVTSCYVNSFFAAGQPPVSTMRAANVIGGGDFAANRIIPDCVRAKRTQKPLVLRNPHAVRPYQYVLEPLVAYLLLAMRQCEEPALAGAYNIGPGAEGCVRTEEIVRLFQQATTAPETIAQPNAAAPYESDFLSLDCAKAREKLHWQPTLSVAQAVALTAQWVDAWLGGEDLKAFSRAQIAFFLQEWAKQGCA